MELAASGTADALAQPRRLSARLDPPAIAAWTLAFSVVVYLALSNGGYDTIVRSQVGIAVWWIVLLGALAGVLPMRFGVAGWVAIGLLAGFAAWTGLAATWSESAERTVVELGRVAAYLGVLVLAIALQGRAAARHTIAGVASAIGLVTLLAILSRLHPQWFPANDHVEFLSAVSARKLSYPLNYWNGLAAFAAMGVPPLIAVALAGRTLAGQALAAAALPLSALCVYLTISRGGALTLAVGVIVFLVFVPRRLDALASLLVSSAGAVILVIAAGQRDAVQDGLMTPAAIDQGTELIWLAIIVCSGVACLQVAIGLMAHHVERPARLAPSPRTVTVSALAMLAVAGVLAVAAGVPGMAQNRWREFKAPVTAAALASEDNVFSRLSGVNGSGRYEYWQSARDANATAPWKGIGPGTFEFWFSRHGTSAGFVRDAHSLYFETLAESGIVGFALLGGLLAFMLVVAVARAMRAPPALRIWTAAAVGGLAAFLTSAAFEWVWEIAAIACVAMLLGAVILAGREPERQIEAPVAAPPSRSIVPRVVLAVLAVVAICAVAVPMAGALATGDSRQAAAQGRLDSAIEDARTAQRLQPYAATPLLQRALVLEEANSLAAAALAARSATAEEPTNWRTWFVLAHIEARRGSAVAAVDALRRAKRLNPRSPLLGAGQ
jgi:hypothetical protein